MISNKIKRGAILTTILLAAIALRFPYLNMRPMHTDEAVHAIKFGTLLEKGIYHYDPQEYHGPTLNYFTLLPAWILSEHTIQQVTETTLRLVPAIFGTLLVVAVLFYSPGLGWPAIFIAAGLTALSPAMVFYSRYYIMEILFVFFLAGIVGAGYQYQRHRNLGWAIITGLFLGLLYATKETWIIFVGAMILSLGGVLFIKEKRLSTILRVMQSLNFRHLLAGLITALVVAGLFYSSFLTYPHGILDSLRTFQNYFNRAGGAESHIHPWYYYLHILLFWKSAPGPVWSEALIVILAMIGGIAAFRENHPRWFESQFLRFVALYTLITLVIFSIIPYKTPWNILGTLFGMILLAGAGGAWLISKLSGRWVQAGLGLILIIATGYLLRVSYITNFDLPADPRNPYVYGHTSNDIYDIVNRINAISDVAPQGKNMYIEVIAPGGDYWPLPWYLRDFPHVGWWTAVNLKVPLAPLVIAKPSVEQTLLQKMYTVPPPGQRDLYVPLFDHPRDLRPGVEIRGYVTNDLWERFQDRSADLPGTQATPGSNG